MTTAVAISFRRSEIIVAITTGCVALMMLGLQPALLGALVEQQRVSLDGVGLVAMGEIFSLGIGVILAEKLLSLRHLRPIAVIAIVLLVAVNLMTLAAHGTAACVALRVAAGLLEAALFWITTLVIVRSAQPDRLAGVFLTASTLAQALVALVLAKVQISLLGWGEGFVVLAAVTLLVLPSVGWLPKNVGTHADAVTPSLVSWRGALTLLVAFAHMCAVGTLWAYLEPLAKSVGISLNDTNSLVALVLLLQIAGGCVAAVVVRRWRVGPVVVITALVFAAIFAAMHRLPPHGSVPFVLLCSGFGFIWLFQMPFHIRLAFDVDPCGRVALLVPPAQLLGCGFGPLMASFAVHGDDVQHVPQIAMAFALCVVVAMLGAIVLRNKNQVLVPEGPRS